MTTTSTNYTINTVQDKKAIVERLFKAGHISLDEVLELMKETGTIQVQQIPSYPVDTVSPYYPWTVTYKFSDGDVPNTLTVVND